jgi:hypothetical protein
VSTHATTPLEDSDHAQRHQRICGTAVVPAPEAISNDSLVLVANIPNATTASQVARVDWLFAPRPATAATVLDVIRLGKPAIVDAFCPPSTARKNHADVGSAYGQDAIHAVEGEGVGDPTELGCSPSTDAMTFALRME